MRRALGTYTGLLLLILYAPILILMAYSFNRSRLGIEWTGFTLDWYRKLFSNHEIGVSLQNTVLLATFSTIIALVLGTAAALAARQSFRGKRWYATLVSLPLVIPDIVMAFSLFILFHTLGISRSLGTAVVAHATFSLSYVAVVVSARLQGMNPAMEQAARDLGAGPVTTFWKVTLPAILPGVVSGALLAFTMSFDDFAVTYFTTGAGNATLPLQIFSMLRHGITPEINAVSTLILLASFVLILISLRITRLPVHGGVR